MAPLIDISVEWAQWLLTLALLSLMVSLILGSREVILYVKARVLHHREIIHDYDLAIVEHGIQEALVELEIEAFYAPAPRVSKRYNIHCPACGRFSKRVFGDDAIVECKRHGILVRWNDITVDWAIIPITVGVSLTTTPIKIISPRVITPITQPIDIIVPDDLSSFYEEVGATI